ncbi:hypothetical protein TWF225_002888, partial [Orbilia oligospora]
MKSLNSRYLRNRGCNSIARNSRLTQTVFWQEPMIVRVYSTTIHSGQYSESSMLASFLPSLKAADEQLEREKLAGRIADRRIEIDSDSDSSDNSSSEEESDSEDNDDDNMSDDDVSAPTSLPPNTMAEVLITNLLSPQQISAEDGDGANVSSSSLSPKKLKKRNKNKQPYIEM